MHYLDAIVGALVGGLLGSALTIFFDGRRKRYELSIKLVDYFFAAYSELAVVKDLLQKPAPLTTDVLARNRVLKMGDWYEMSATLCNKNLADAKLLRDIGIVNEMQDFHNRVVVASASVDRLSQALKSWTNMDQLLKK